MVPYLIYSYLSPLSRSLLIEHIVWYRWETEFRVCLEKTQKHSAFDKFLFRKISNIFSKETQFTNLHRNQVLGQCLIIMTTGIKYSMLNILTIHKLLASRHLSPDEVRVGKSSKHFVQRNQQHYLLCGNIHIDLPCVCQGTLWLQSPVKHTLETPVWAGKIILKWTSHI